MTTNITDAHRHSFASRALALGESLMLIGKLLGHSKIDTTSRYAHLARDSIKASSVRVADSIGADILDRKPVESHDLRTGVSSPVNDSVQRLRPASPSGCPASARRTA